jgi:adenylosuccinate synthase
VTGIEELMLTKLDVLDDLDTIQIGTAYKINGGQTEVFPTNLGMDDQVEVVYESMPGWKSPTKGCRSYGELPENARKYIERIERILGVPVSVVSVSPDRDGVILRKKDFFR